MSKDKQETVESMISNIKNYINTYNKFVIIQSVIGYK